MKKLLSVLCLTAFFVVILVPEVAEARRYCPSGWVKRGRKCVKYRYSCPSGTVRRGNKCYRTTYKCRAGCTYVGGGKCRCYRRR